jgi:YD repeat-containing protein
MNKIVGLVMLCLVTSFVHAQDMDKLKNVIPPSPNASSLGKYADWPVSLYTGVPNISVPLYTLRGRSTSVPITLGYHSSGIKVSEVASWVGLGFSLDAGGIITRSVRGLPDDDGGYLKNREGFTDKNDMSSPVISNPTFESKDNLELKLAQGRLDSEPDYYMFNALGKSFKMFFHGNEILTQPHSNLKFVYWFGGNLPNEYNHDADNSLEYWEVWMEDGTHLLFGKGEDYLERVPGAKYGSSQDGSFTPITAWYLKEIRTTTNDVVRFFYDEEETEQTVTYSESQRLRLETGTPHSPEPITKSYSRPKVKTKILSKIVTALDSAVFQTEARADLLDGHALKEIFIYSLIDKTCVRKFKFNYEYSEAVLTPTYYTAFGYNKRLKLESLIEGDETYSFKKIWSFEYNAASLPSRTSYAQDHWGYFNGAASNSTLLPRDLRFPVTSKYANREPNPESTKAEMLTRITYPTGGYSEFEFGQNYATVTEAQYTRNAKKTLTAPGSVQFIIHEPMIVKLQFSATLKGFQDVADHVTLAQARITDGTGALVSGSSAVTFKRPDFGNITNRQLADGAEALGDKTVEVLLPTGTYTLAIVALDNAMLYASNATLTYDEYLGTYPAPRAVGGLRVERIVDFDDETGQVNERTFQYDSAFLIHKVRPTDYSGTSEVRNYSGDVSGGLTIDFTYYNTRYSNNPAPIGTISGGNVGYGKVTTFFGAGGANGRSISKFRSESDIFSVGSELPPYAPVTDMGWRRGLLIEKTDFDKDGTKVTRDRIEYDFDKVSMVRALKVGFKVALASESFDEAHRSQLIVNAPYEIVTERVKTMKTTSVQYVKTGEDLLESAKSVRTSVYGNIDNMQPTGTEVIDSKQSTLKTITRTALERDDLVGAAEWIAVVDSMKSRNMIGLPIQSETYKDNVLLQRATTDYRLSLEGFILPASVSIKGSATAIEETRLKFIKYDGKGNLLEQSKVNDARHAYIFDYSSSLPIAEAVNASYTDIAYTGFESTGTGRWNVPSTARVLTEAFTGEKSYNLFSGVITRDSLDVTKTYVVSLWAKTGSTIGINGGATVGESIGGWTYYSRVIAASTSVTINGSGNIDDVKLRPVNSLMTVYAHGSFGVVAVTSPNERRIFYEYDGLGRLTTVKDQRGNIVQRNSYNYKVR